VSTIELNGKTDFGHLLQIKGAGAAFQKLSGSSSKLSINHRGGGRHEQQTTERYRIKLRGNFKLGALFERRTHLQGGVYILRLKKAAGENRQFLGGKVSRAVINILGI